VWEVDIEACVCGPCTTHNLSFVIEFQSKRHLGQDDVTIKEKEKKTICFQQAKSSTLVILDMMK
jgi:hypothetical protein